MTDNEIKVVSEKIESLHDKILKSKFAETVTESEMLSLIFAVRGLNEQKAEIEELNEEIDRQYEQAKADILGNMADGGTSCHWCIEQHKAEAVKGFAENLTKDIKSHRTEINLNGLKGTHRTDEITYQTVIEYIDNLVKEMVGEG